MDWNRIMPEENEVVEYFDSRPGREVVLTHVQGRPLPRRWIAPPQAAPEPAPAAPAKRKKLRPAWIVVICILGAVFLFGAIYGCVCLYHEVISFNQWNAEYDKESAEDEDAPYTQLERTTPGGAEVVIAAGHGEALTPQEIYAGVNPAVVTVITQVDEVYSGVGTGIIFTDDGFILTNAHVIEGAVACEAVLSDGRSYDALLVGYDEEQDLAVLKVEAQGLPTVEFGDSDALVVGDPVYAIGNPLGYELRGTLTDGMVSAINRDVTVESGTMTLIQTNAALNNGNSGGPLINAYGQVVGINVIKMVSSYGSSVEGLGFAIPISAAAETINELIETGSTSAAPSVVLGLSVNYFADEAEEDVFGLAVVEVTADSAAHKAGICVGDYILAVNGETVWESGDILRARRGLRPGDEMEMTIWREGEIFDVTLVMQEPA